MSGHGARQLTREAIGRIVRENFGSPSPTGGFGFGVRGSFGVVAQAALRLAAYPEDFLRSVRGRKFHHPETGNRVVFVSLPAREQARIFSRWRATEGRGWGPAAEGGAGERVTGETFSRLERGQHLRLRDLESGEEREVVVTETDHGNPRRPNVTVHDSGVPEEGRASWNAMRMGPDDLAEVEVSVAARGRTAAYSDRFMEQVRGTKFRHPETGNDVLFVSLPGAEQSRVYGQWVQKNAPPGLQVDPECPECGGTGWYTGFREREECRTCRQKQQERAERARSRQEEAAEGERATWEAAKKVEVAGGDPPKELVDLFWPRFSDAYDDYADDDGWDRIYDEVLDELMENEHSPFHGASPDLDTDDEAEHDRAEERFMDARGWTKKITDEIHEGLGGGDDDRDKEATSFTMKNIDDWRTLGEIERTATYPPEFMQLAARRKFRQPSTGNMVQFVSLLPEEQAKIYAVYQRNVAARAEKERERRRKRPTFAKAKEAVFDELDAAGWETRRGLKVPKAVKTIGENRVILHFKPQAVWMEVRGRENVPPRSLHDDLRDVDPAKWVESLGDEAESRVRSEEEQNAPYRRAAAGSFTMKSIDDWKTIDEQRLGKTAAYTQEFLDWARDRKFRNDQTGNRVRFDQLPPAERDRVHDSWEQAREDRMGRRMWVDAGPSDELVQVFRVRFDEGDLSDDDRVYGGDRMFDEIMEELLYGEHSRFRGGSPDLDTDDDAEHEHARQLYEDARRWAHLIVDRLEDERKGIAPRTASLATWRTVDEERVGSSRDDFERQMQEGGRTFSNPATGNRVKFKSLPHEVQDRIYRQWQATRPPDPGQRREEPSESEYERHLMERGDESGMGHDDTRQMYADGLEGWSFLPVGDAGEREAFVVQQGPGMAAPPLREPGVPQTKVVQPMLGPDGEPIEPPPPAQIRRQLAERMRDLGRALMISGTRAPRQQMIEVGRALDALIDQLELLADQPGRQALKRRILLGLRQRVLSNR